MNRNSSVRKLGIGASMLVALGLVAPDAATVGLAAEPGTASGENAAAFRGYGWRFAARAPADTESATIGPPGSSGTGRSLPGSSLATGGNRAAAPTAALGIAQLAASQAMDQAAESLFGGVPEWLRRVEFGWTFNAALKPEYSLLTIQPLFQSDAQQDTIFVQGRVASGPGDRVTTNLGVGYRRLVADNRLMLGVNGFYDQEWEIGHKRVSFGAEARSQPLDLITNYYVAATGAQQVSPGIFERPLDGVDVELGVQVPYLPWAKGYYRRSQWFGVERPDFHTDRFALRLRPLPLVEIEAGRLINSRSDDATFVIAAVNLALDRGMTGGAAAESLVDDTPFRFGDMRSATLEKVRRENTIVVETVGRARGTVLVARGS